MYLSKKWIKCLVKVRSLLLLGVLSRFLPSKCTADAREEMLENETPFPSELPSERTSLIDHTLPIPTTYRIESMSSRRYIPQRGFNEWFGDLTGRGNLKGRDYAPVASGSE